MTQIDYDREMAFVAVRTSAEKSEIPLGVTRAISDPDNIDAEFAVLVRSDLKGLGLGRRLLEKLIAYTQSHGLQRLNGITMPNNRGMMRPRQKAGIHRRYSAGRWDCQPVAAPESGIIGATLTAIV